MLPALAAGISALLRQSSGGFRRALAIGSMAISLAARSMRLCAELSADPSRQVVNFHWMQFGSEWISLGWVLDPLTAIMLVMVAFVGLLIFIYSLGYMAHDANFTRFFCFLSLFAGAMFGVVIANSLLLLFICWEVVGLTSYLLIGFWYQKPERAAAAKKAFITTRIGDLGLLLGMVWLYSQAGTLLFYDNGAGCLEHAALIALCSAQPTSRRHGRFHRDRAADLLRRGRKIRPGAAARLAARRHGRSNAGQRADSRRHHGRGRRLSRRARLSVDERSCARRRRSRTRAHRSSPGLAPSPPSSPPASPSRRTTSSASSPTRPSLSSAT